MEKQYYEAYRELRHLNYMDWFGLFHYIISIIINFETNYLIIVLWIDLDINVIDKHGLKMLKLKFRLHSASFGFNCDNFINQIIMIQPSLSSIQIVLLFTLNDGFQIVSVNDIVAVHTRTIPFLPLFPHCEPQSMIWVYLLHSW